MGDYRDTETKQKHRRLQKHRMRQQKTVQIRAMISGGDAQELDAPSADTAVKQSREQQGRGKLWTGASLVNGVVNFSANGFYRLRKEGCCICSPGGKS